MERLLEQLKKAGVPIMKNDFEILLEIFNDKLSNSSEIDAHINELISNITRSEHKKILFECPMTLLNNLSNMKEKMKIVGERVIFTKEFSDRFNISVPPYEVWSITEPRALSFLFEMMGVDKTEKFLMSMGSELPTQVNKMFTVYLIDNEPIGVVFPHIEPETDQEGRIFWIGIYPKFLGKGFGKDLHLIGLYRLQHEFKAKSYLGATKIENLPMRKIMSANGCDQHKNSVISLEYSL
ncbi:GNAT family N-acetyltransferase [Bacillus sp. FJAT-49705]|uniref:GNAT family N-acetyltransferase n=1 Tax=Cytobacillus citreus TaxID=2833586 RepID=A0ABS5P076_9BACI|nr:GNAT family N-acetyltransferase [Cytobacillus citreus]MBS4192768.1 GNAT family N-acetyltransferase [Cytobacillus citreus]